MRRSLIVLALSAVFATLYPAPLPAESVTVPVSFVDQVAPVLSRECASCHLTGQEAGELALYPKVAWRSLVSVPSVQSPLLRVVPGEPEKSYFMLKLEGGHLDAGGMGVQMPIGQPPLDKVTLVLIRAWIAQGANNN